jgi:serine/threonine-protein phosphatase PGAM5
MLKGAEETLGPCKIKALRVSGMTRAKETADIIASFLPGVEYVEPDPLLSEGRPSHHIPSGKVSDKIIEATDHNHPRIEEAFQKYFHRADPPSEEANPQSDGEPQHQFEIVVCHANVIRYFLCRALQLPPEAWLRYCPFNCSLTYMTIRPTGTVSCRMLGDIGHLPYDQSTFSSHRGFNW